MSKRKFRLGCAVPHMQDGTSWHRAIGPLAAMAAESREGWSPMELELVTPRKSVEGWEMTWDFAIQCDAIFLQRPAFPAYLQFAKMCRGLELPLWVEFDDDYTCIPPSNPHYEQYADQETHAKVMSEVARLADVITVATPEMGRRIEALMAKSKAPKFKEDAPIVVVPNACHNRFYEEPRERCVIWRGTETHMEDVCTVLKELGEVSRLPQYSNWTFHFSGGPPWQVYQAIPKERLAESPFAGPVFFVPLLALFGGWVQIVPLKNNAFNRCKSNVAWIEATCAGSVVLAPNSEEWLRPGIVNYSNAAEFQEKLRHLMHDYGAVHDGAKDGEVRLHPNVELSRKYIKENLMLADVNKMRWEIVEELAGGRDAETSNIEPRTSNLEETAK